MSTKPYVFQKSDIQTVWEEYGGRAGIFWSPGLGKTFAALYGAKKYLKQWPIVVVCPAIAKGVWREEARKHLGIKACVLYHRKPYTPPPAPVYVVNYDILRVPTPNRITWVEVLAALKPGLIVFDECQMLSNPNSARSRASRELSRGIPHALGLSGTPVMNRPAEFFTILNIIDRKRYPSFRNYAELYCDLKRGPAGWDFSGASNLPLLHKRVFVTNKACAVRRRKEDVIDDLPPLTTDVVPLRLSKSRMDEYRTAEREYAKWYRQPKDAATAREIKAKALAGKTRLRVLAAKLKYDLVAQWISNFLEGDQKLLVFGIHKWMLHSLTREFAKYQPALVTGEVVDTHRDKACARFNDDPSCRLFIANIIAGGVAWSCTSASTVAFCELSWVPTDYEQAIGRVRGIKRGTGKPVNAHWLVAEGTIESDMVRVNSRKERITSLVMDGKSNDSSMLKLMDQLDDAILKRNQ